MDQVGTGFQPAHRVPEGGVPTWATPDATLPKGERLAPGTPVEVLEQRPDGWAQVRREDGWTVWVDGRRLVGMPPPAPPPPAQTAPPPPSPPASPVPQPPPAPVGATSAPWHATHTVGAQGAPAWSEPDPALAPEATIDSRLEVQLVEQRPDGWAHVVCSNGWSAWVDSRRLQPVGAQTQQRFPVPALGAAGLALIVLGSFLPWFTGGRLSTSAWDVALRYVLLNETTNSGPKAGVALLVPLVLLIPWLARKPVHWLVTTLLAALATTLSVEAFARANQVGHGLHVGIGVFVTFAGGILLAGEAWHSSFKR